MKAISDVIQGGEQTLFNRVLLHIQQEGCSRRYIQEFEKYETAPFDEILEVSYRYLTALGYW